jgi:hypothetical protein
VKRRFWRGALGLALAVLPCACVEPLPPALPPAPELNEPAFAVPADLDLVIRVDVDRLRDVLGGGFEAVFDDLVKRTPAGERDGETGRLLLAILMRANTVWLAARPGLSPELTDNVLIARGPFAGLVPEAIGGDPPWRHSERLGGGVLRYERAAPELRSSPAVLYLREPDLVIVGSTAEIDALELTIEKGQGGPPLRTKEAGIVALAARTALLERRLRERAPTVARLLGGAERLSCAADVRAGNVEVDLELEYESPESAAQVAPAIREVFAVLGRSGFDWLRRTQVEAVGPSVTVRWVVAEDEAKRLLACWVGAGCARPRKDSSDVLPSAPE